MQSGRNKRWPSRLRRSGRYVMLCYVVLNACDQLSKVATRSQNLQQKMLQSSQKQPKVAKSCQKLSKVAKSCQKLPKVAESLFVFLSFCLSVFLSFCLSVFLSFCTGPGYNSLVKAGLAQNTQIYRWVDGIYLRQLGSLEHLAVQITRQRRMQHRKL